ncbi:hypothetical protein CRM22_005801 [Opisthorchis felineus]|uniref:Peptidylglycine monooxygenase n=1 Tax=Opisthorchis felineus TaxID=147828 RepID=A0A4S2LPC9_OPIFE|nr:hypothetical protein CRM22_005801 [Opisthorchis felineus]
MEAMDHKCCLILLLCALLRSSTMNQFTELEEYDLKMPGVQTEQEDGYVTFWYPVMSPHRTFYVTDIIPKPNHSTAHHMILMGCTELLRAGPPRKQAEHSSSCSILYAWAHNAPPLHLPVGVGIAVGPSTPIESFKLELHYLPKVNYPDYSGLTLRYTAQTQPRVVGVFLMLSNWALIEPGRKNVTVDISCRVPEGVSITLMAMRTHAHDLSRAVAGYLLPRGQPPAQLLGMGNPQWPQAFYSLKSLNAKFNSIDISSGDILLARCVYDSTSRTRVTQIGHTHSDEMCNLYLLYHTNSFSLFPPEEGFCMVNEFNELAQKVMDENPDMPSSTPPKIVRGSVSDLLGSSSGTVAPNISLPRILRLDGLQIGQLSAVATAEIGGGHELVLLHRCENRWNSQSFDGRYRYRHKNAYVTSDPVVHLDPVSMHVKHTWGANQFVLPHGIRVIHNTKSGAPEAVFITDVALHQVFKFNWGQWDEPAIVWGTAFEPGSSPRHFCQPADVDVSSSGEIFIADGYCNSRIVKFAANGTYLSDWSTLEHKAPDRSSTIRTLSPRYRLQVREETQDMDIDDGSMIVHSLTMIPPEANALEQVCAANRERAEIVCFTTAGEEVARYGGSGLLPKIYAIAYSQRHRVLFAAINADDNMEQPYKSHGVLLDPIRPHSLEQLSSHPEMLTGLKESGAIVGFFAMPQIVQPHAMTITTSGRHIYAVDLASSIAFSFEIATNGDIAQDSTLARFFQNTVSTAGYWVSHQMSGAQLAGLIMLFVLLVFIALIVCIHMCWCGRHSPAPAILRNRSSRWTGRPKKAQRVGFRLLNQDGDPSCLETDDEDEQEDVILQTTRHNGFVTLQVDAERGKITDRKSLSQLARDYENMQSNMHSKSHHDKINGDLKKYVA